MPFSLLLPASLMALMGAHLLRLHERRRARIQQLLVREGRRW